MSNRKPRFEEILTVGRSYGRLSEAPGLWKGNVGLWSFAEGGGGKVYDVSGRGNNGTLTNGPTWVGEGLSFDGSGDYVASPDSPSLDITGALTFGLFFRSSGFTGDDAGLMSKGADAEKYFHISASKTYEMGILNDKIYFQISDGTNVGLVSGSSSGFDDGLWHLLLARWDGTTDANGMQIWFDGAVLYQRASAVSSIQTLASELDIGGYNSSWPFLGEIKDAFVWNRALLTPEIRQLYQDQDAMLRLRPRTIGLPTAAPVVSTRGGILHRGQVPGILSRAG